MIAPRNLLAFFFLTAFVVCLVNGQNRPGSGNTRDKLSKLFKFLDERKICREVRNSRKTFEGFYTQLTLKCYWSAFVDAASDPSRLRLDDSSDQSRRGGKQSSEELEIYEIEFEQSSKLPEARYKTFSGKLFKGLNVRSVRASGLDIERVEEDSFDTPNFGNYLYSLDLSRNSIRRLDSHTLSNLKGLQNLNLSYNRLTFGEHNFDNNIHLRVLDVSNNDLQFLSPRVFASLHELEWLSVSRNNIRKIDACTFASLQTSPISARYSPIYIDLQGNPIECDCQVFFLNRYLNYRLNLTCDKPEYYKGKTFEGLKREDPAYRCDYEKMEAKCHPGKSLSERDLYFVIVAGSLIAILILISCFCCCNSIVQSGKVISMKSALADAQRAAAQNQTKKSYYVQVEPHDDTQKLIVHDK